LKVSLKINLNDTVEAAREWGLKACVGIFQEGFGVEWLRPPSD